MEVIFGELARRRAEIAATRLGDASVTDFKVEFLKGPWTFEHKGVYADAARAFARGDYALDFWRRRNVPASARFEIALYTEVGCGVLGRAWASRMQYFLSKEVESGDTAHVSTVEEVASYLEPTEFTDLIEASKGHAHMQKRGRQTRALFA